MDPYRAPQRVEPPPRDKLNPILVAAVLFLVVGAIAVIAGSAIKDYRASLPPSLIEPLDTTPRSGHDGWSPPVSSVQWQALRPPGFDAKLAFETSSGTCFGDCIPYSVLIESDGHTRLESPQCGSASRVASQADLAGLRERTRNARLERYGSSAGFSVTDVPRLHTVVVTDGVRHDIRHIGMNIQHDPGFGRLLELHDAIERVARVEPWLASCRATRSERTRMEHSRY